MVELSPRLEQIGRMVAQGSVVADIGTDHGQLMAWLGERGILRAGYACDINKKPLDKARRILAELGLSDTVACVQAPGLEGLEPETAYYWYVQASSEETGVQRSALSRFVTATADSGTTDPDTSPTDETDPEPDTPPAGGDTDKPEEGNDTVSPETGEPVRTLWIPCALATVSLTGVAFLLHSRKRRAR